MSKVLGFVVGAALVFGGLLYLLTPTGAAPATVGLELPAPPPGKPDAEPAHQQAPATSKPTGRIAVRQQALQPEHGPVSETGPDEASVAAQAPAPAAVAATLQSDTDTIDEQALVEQALAAMQEPASAPAQPGPGAVLPDATAAEPAAEIAPLEDDREWFAVWDPFHSELSANAFASRLERLTGLDYRVIRSDRAKYEVAVAFASEPERVANIALIEEATGLRIAGGDL